MMTDQKQPDTGGDKYDYNKKNWRESNNSSVFPPVEVRLER